MRDKLSGLIDRAIRKADFIAAFLPKQEADAVRTIYNHDFLENVYYCLLTGMSKGFPLPEARDLMVRVDTVMKHVPSFLAHHLPLLRSILLHAQQEPSLPLLGHVDRAKYEKHYARTLLAGFTRFLILSISLFKDIILTHAQVFAKRVMTPDAFAQLITVLTGMRLELSHEAVLQFTKHVHDARFKITTFEKIVHFLKKEGRARVYHGVYDLGRSHEYVRILLIPLGHAWQVVWWGTIHEHAIYEHKLRDAQQHHAA